MNRGQLLFGIVCMLFLCFLLRAQEENPFMAMAGRPYVEYAGALHAAYVQTESLDSAGIERMVEQARRAAKKYNSQAWMLEAEMLEVNNRYFQGYYRDSLPGSYSADDMVADLAFIAQKAEKAGAYDICLRALKSMLDRYNNDIRNYELAFETCLQIDKALSRVTVGEFPAKMEYYIQIGEQYFHHRDYESAASFFRKIIAEADSVGTLTLSSAYNGMGLVYNMYYHDLVRSDSCYNAILSIQLRPGEEAWCTDVWSGIAKGNLGDNYFERGEYAASIQLEQYAMEKSLQYNDYSFAAGSATMLAENYLATGDLHRAKAAMDTAIAYTAQARTARRKVDLYRMMSHYYMAVNDLRKAYAYKDSAQLIQNRLEEDFSAINLLRAEQRVNLVERRLKEEELDAEKLRNIAYRRHIITLSTGMLLITALLTVVCILYRKKRSAHRELVRQSQRWAADNTMILPNVPVPLLPPAGTTGPDTADRSLMESIHHLIAIEKLYTQPDLTLETLSDRLNVNRNYVSQAINRCTGRHFNTYINEYRVKKAIRLLSDTSPTRPTIDGIAFESGFNDRSTFSRVFKKTTGLSPSAFRNNLQEVR